ncbi:hypothetical protein [Leuconostoc pseudomesenteroides]
MQHFKQCHFRFCQLC